MRAPGLTVPWTMAQTVLAAALVCVKPSIVTGSNNCGNAEAGEMNPHYQPVRTTRSSGDPRDVADAARLILEAKSPVIQAG